MRLPYRRHRNGNGRLYGEEKVFVSRDSWIEWDSEIHGESHISTSEVYGSLVVDSTLHRAVVVSVELKTGVVDGPARLQGPWSLTGPFYIRSGLWTRPPRHKILSHESGIHVGLTESSEGRSFIACEEKLVTDWLRMGLRIGRWLQWPDSLAREAYYFMQELESVKEVAA